MIEENQDESLVTRFQQYLLCILAAIALSTSAFSAEPSQTTECSLKQLASIDVKVDNKVLIPVSFGDRRTFMALRTTSLSTISKEAADDMKLPIGPVPAEFSKDPNTVGVATVQSLTLGSLQVGKVEFLVSRLTMTSSPTMPEFIGWLGIDALGGVDLELDLAHYKLKLFSSDHCPGRAVYWTNTGTSVPYTLDPIGVPVFAIELDGKSIQATIRTTGARTQLRTDISKRLFGFDESSPGIQLDTPESGKPQSHYRAMKMTAQGLSVTNADVELTPGNKNCHISLNTGPQHAAGYENCYGSPPLALGMDVLRHLRIYIATKEHMLYITAADSG
jgi:hypothetical protein